MDLAIFINGGMDAFLLMLTARLLHRATRWYRILFAVAVGEVPVLGSLFAVSPWLTIMKVVTPFLMVWVLFPNQGIVSYMKGLCAFWVLSAGLGGVVYGLWNWLLQEQSDSGGMYLALSNLWLLPLCAGLWWGGQHFKERWAEHGVILKQAIYDLEIDFGKTGEVVTVKALLDTGNHLRDPMTGVPVILLEEGAGASAMPEAIRSFLQMPWKGQSDPWSLLWRMDPELVKRLVFIPFQAVDHQSWLLGVRPMRVRCLKEEGPCEVRATVALVDHALSPDQAYRALLHPEHVLGQI